MRKNEKNSLPANFPFKKILKEIILVFLTILAFLFSYFWQIFSPDIYTRKTFVYDFYYFVLPYQWNIQYLLHFHWLPLWDSLSSNGYPILADPTQQLFYFPNLIRLFLLKHITLYQTIYSIELIHILHLVFLSIGVFLFLRVSQRLSFKASLLGSIAITFNGFIINRISRGHLDTIDVLTWLPWVLFSATEYFSATNRFYFFLLTVSAFLAITAGYTPLAYLCFLLVIGYVIYVKALPLDRLSITRLLLIGLSFLLALGLSMIVFLPAIQYSSLTERIGDLQRYENSKIYSMHPIDMVRNFIFPDLDFRTESYVYLGIPISILTFISISLGKHKRHGKFFISVFFIGLLMSLGEILGPLFGPLFFWPNLGIARIPSRIMFFSDFSACILAASYLDNLFKDEAMRSKLLSHLKSLIKSSVVPLSILVILILSSFPLIKSLNLIKGQNLPDIYNLTLLTIIFISVSIFVLLRISQKPSNVLTGILIFLIFLDLSIANYSSMSFFNYTDLQKLIKNRNLNEYDKNNYASSLRGDYRYNADFTNDFLYDMRPSIKAATPLGFLSIYNLELEDNPTIKKIRGMTKDKNGIEKRWWIVSSCTFVNSTNDMLSAIRQQNIDASKTILVLEKDRKNIQSYCTDKDLNSTLTLNNYENNKISFSYFSNDNTMLYLSETYYPGWSANIDGKSEPVVLANSAFRAVPLEKGNHTVTLSFFPNMLMLGTVISIVSFIMFILTVLLHSYILRIV